MNFLEDNKFIYVKSLEIIKDNLQLLKESRYGANSDIYIYNQIELLKVYKSLVSIQELVDLQTLKNISTSSIVKPNKFLILNDQYYGFSMDRFYGKILLKLDYNVMIRDFLKSLLLLEKDLIEISKNKFYAEDLNSFNLLYDDKKNLTKIVDSNSIILLKDESEERINIMNLTSFYILIAMVISNMSLFANGNNNSFFIDMMSFINDRAYFDASIEEFFSIIVEMLENRVDRDIQTIGDFRKCLKLANN